MRTEIKAALVLGLFGILGMVIWGINSGRQSNVDLPMDVGKDAGKTTRLASDSPGGRERTQPRATNLNRDDGARRPDTSNPSGRSDRAGQPPETRTPPIERDSTPPIVTPPPESRLGSGGSEPLPAQVQPGRHSNTGPPMPEASTSSPPVHVAPSESTPAVATDRPGSELRTPDSSRPRGEEPLTPERGGVSRFGDLPRSPTAETSYTIQQGDTFISIAREKYGDDKYWVRIQAANPDLEPSRLMLNTVIKLPAIDDIQKTETAAAKPAGTDVAASGVGARRAPYRVAEGDTLISIARNVLKKESRWHEIFELNRDQLTSADHIVEGMMLKIPE
jgi:nucleoid-associated protein YgaU